MREAILPSYAKALDNGKVSVDAEQFYPMYLEELQADENWPTDEEINGTVLKDEEGNDTGDRGPVDNSMSMYKGLQHERVDQYWLEVAYACMKLDIQRAVAGTVLNPKGGATVILVQDGSKAKNGEETGKAVSSWAIKAHPPGRGVAAAVQGRESREHYKRIRGGLL